MSRRAFACPTFVDTAGFGSGNTFGLSLANDGTFSLRQRPEVCTWTEAAALEQLLCDVLQAQTGDTLWGTVHVGNGPSIGNALAVDREKTAAFVWVQRRGELYREHDRWCALHCDPRGAVRYCRDLQSDGASLPNGGEVRHHRRRRRCGAEGRHDGRWPWRRDEEAPGLRRAYHSAWLLATVCTPPVQPTTATSAAVWLFVAKTLNLLRSRKPWQSSRRCPSAATPPQRRCSPKPRWGFLTQSPKPPRESIM